MEQTMIKSNRTTSYVFTADPQSVTDMQQIEIVKKSVKSMNDTAKNSHKWAVRRAEYNGTPLPKAPTLYRVRLMARGPRRAAAIADGRRKWAYDSSLPQRHATHFDVYIHEVR
jgi:outer membrane lipoprotein-sorting protein